MGIELPYEIDDKTERGKDFNVPDGDYLVKVIVCEENVGEGGKNDFIQLELEIVDADKKNDSVIGLSIYDILSLSDKAKFRVADFLDAAYPPRFRGKAIPDDIDDGKKLMVVRARKETYKDRDRVRVAKFNPASDWKSNSKPGATSDAQESTEKDSKGEGEGKVDF